MSAAAKCTGKAGALVLAIPLGTDADGLPFGMTVFSVHGEDAMVLRAGAWIENVIGRGSSRRWMTQAGGLAANGETLKML